MAHARSEISPREKSAQKNRWQDRPDSYNNTWLYISNPTRSDVLQEPLLCLVLLRTAVCARCLQNSRIDSLNPSGLRNFLHDNAVAIKAAGFSDPEFGSILTLSNMAGGREKSCFD